ncbi:MAG: MFS transporter [Victivallaceae bacterium]
MPASLALTLFMLTYAMSQFSAQLTGAVGNAWAGEIIPPRESTAFWNRRSGFALIASMVAGILAGKVVDILGKDARSTYAIIMGVGVLFGYASTFSNFVMPDPDPHPVRRESPLTQVKAILANKQFLWFTGFFSFQSMAAWVSSGFIFVYLQRDMQFSMTSVQILSAIACLVGFVSAYFSGSSAPSTATSRS